jgi:hypothetical protein
MRVSVRTLLVAREQPEEEGLVMRVGVLVGRSLPE